MTNETTTEAPPRKLVAFKRPGKEITISGFSHIEEGGHAIAYFVDKADADNFVHWSQNYDKMVRSLEWFADSANWREECLSEGLVYSAEWRVGMSPIDFAKRVLVLAKAKGETK